jgi:hypothetical protein
VVELLDKAKGFFTAMVHDKYADQILHRDIPEFRQAISGSIVHSLGQLRYIAMPLLQGFAAEIPLPKIEGSTDSSHYTLDNIVLRGNQVSLDDMSLGLKVGLKDMFRMVLTVKNFKLSLSDFHFTYDKTSAPKWHDEGVVSAEVRMPRFKLAWAVKEERVHTTATTAPKSTAEALAMTATGPAAAALAVPVAEPASTPEPTVTSEHTSTPAPRLELEQVVARIRRLDIKLAEARHKTLDRMVLGLFAGAIRSRAQAALDDTLRRHADSLTEKFNFFFEKAVIPPPRSSSSSSPVLPSPSTSSPSKLPPSTTATPAPPVQSA